MGQVVILYEPHAITGLVNGMVRHLLNLYLKEYITIKVGQMA